MSKPKHISEILREIAQNPQTDFEKAIAQLPCRQALLKDEKTPLDEWIDAQDVMKALHISPRTLQTLRSNGILPYSRIGNKIYYRRQDILKILWCVNIKMLIFVRYGINPSTIRGDLGLLSQAPESVQIQ